MRAFWGVVLVLLVIGIAFVAWTAGESRRPTAATPPSDAASVDRVSTPNDDATSASSDGSVRAQAAPPPETSEPSTAPAPSTRASTPEAPEASGASGASNDTAAPPPPEIDLLGESGAVVIPPPTPRTLRTDDRKPSDVVRRIDERTLELDGRYRITGNGSDADPYAITWELLTSASEYIDPAQGARTPPPWVRILDGTYVRISGYYSTPVRVAVAKNLLLTLNRWDGCCIGVPPTAFDAIDITMRDPLPMRGLHLTRFGTFKGLFRAECLDAAGFLIGLYRFEDATFETK
jgi:hypothetical protein